MKILEIYNELFEGRVYGDDEVIDFDDVNLVDEFNKLNKLLFGGKIKPILVKWGFDRNLIGSIYYKKDGNKFIISSLRMSKFYNLTYGQFKNTLAHEMIHAYLFQRNIDHDHDEPFLKEMMRINGMGLGFRITTSEEVETYPEISSHVKGRELVYLTFNLRGFNHIVVMSPDTYKVSYKLLARAYKNMGEEGNEFAGSFWLSNNVLLRSFRVQKIKGDTIKVDSIDDDMLSKLMADSKKLSEFVTDGKKIIWK